MSLLLALMLAQAADITEIDCAVAVVQQDLNWCAARDFAKADAELNAQWATTVAQMRLRDMELTQADRELRHEGWPGYYATLLAAQRAWLVYRDNHCDSAGYAAWGGSMEPMLVAMCRTDLTQQRTRQLQELIEP